MEFMMAAAFGSLVIVLSQLGLMVNPASGPIAIMFKVPVAPPEPAARMKYVVPAVAAKLTLAWLPAQDGPLSSLHIKGLREPQLPVYTASTVSYVLPQVLILTVPLNAGV